MINKKLLAAASVAVAVAASSSAFAKTEGHYAGLDLLRSSSTFQYNYGNGSKDPKVKDKAIGVGLNYKYAFNMNNFFIAPGAFLEMNRAEAIPKNDGPTTTETFKINSRYGLKADVGYDILDNLAVYVTGGVASVNYEYELKSSRQHGKKSGNEIGYLYGLGLSYSVTKDIGLNAEYNVQSIDYQSPFVKDKVNADLSVMKVGVSYHF